MPPAAFYAILRHRLLTFSLPPSRHCRFRRCYDAFAIFMLSPDAISTLPPPPPLFSRFRCMIFAFRRHIFFRRRRRRRIFASFRCRCHAG